MKKNIIVILIFTALTFSCYQTPESSSGSVSVNLDTSVMKDAPAGFDGELRLAVFDGGDLDSLIDISGEPEISYLGDFPTPLLANNSVPVTGRSGLFSILNVPSDKPLTLLIEYDGGYWDPEDIPPYYHSYSGVSEEFEVEGGGTAEVTVTLIQTADGSIAVNKGPLTTSAYFRVFADEDFGSFITISGSDIKELSTSTTIWESHYHDSDGGTFFTSEQAILPGRKFRVIVSENSTIDNWSYPDVGISGTFEVQPGLTKSVSLTFYTYNNDSCISYSC